MSSLKKYHLNWRESLNDFREKLDHYLEYKPDQARFDGLSPGVPTNYIHHNLEYGDTKSGQLEIGCEKNICYMHAIKKV